MFSDNGGPSQAEIDRGWIKQLREQLTAERTAKEAAEAEAVRLRAFSQDLVEAQEAAIEALQLAEIHCPCGARPESLATHPHVPSCYIDKALRALLDARQSAGGA
jgi:hypothetical protein